MIRTFAIAACFVMSYLCCGAFLPFVATVEASDLYVDQLTGDDDNSGTEAEPWATLEMAASSAQAGDTVWIKGGTYTERLAPQRSGEAGAYITYQNYPGDTVVIVSPNTEEYDCGICLEDVHHIAFRGTGIALTNQSLRELEREGIPDETVQSLKPLEEQAFIDEDDLLAAVRQLIGAEQTAQYRELILDHIVTGLSVQGANYANVSAYDESLTGQVHSIILDGLTIDGTSGDISPEGEPQSSYNGIIFSGVVRSEIRNCMVKNHQYNIELEAFNENIVIEGNDVGPSRIAYRQYDRNWQQEGDRRWSHNIMLYSEGEDGKQNQHIKILNNHTHHAEMQGILVWRANHVLVRGNHAEYNGATGIQIESDANPAAGMTTKAIVVEDNVCEWNSQKWDSEGGLWVDDSSDVLVQRNISRYNEVGIQVTGSSQVIVRNNIVHDNAPPELLAAHPDFINSGAIRAVTSPDGLPGADNIFVHNTLFRNGLGSQHGQVHLGAWSTSPAGLNKTVFKNNIVAEPRPQAYDLDLELEIFGQDIMLDHNIYYQSNANPETGRGIKALWQVADDPWKDQGDDCEDGVCWTNCQDWETYRALSGQDAHSLRENPLFIAPHAGDFSLQSGSPARDANESFLTRVTAESGSGTIITVADARYFSYGFGVHEVDGDLVQIGDNAPVRVVDVNYNANTLTVDAEISWKNNDPVSYTYAGDSPDIGALLLKQSSIQLRNLLHKVKGSILETSATLSLKKEKPERQETPRQDKSRKCLLKVFPFLNQEKS